MKIIAVVTDNFQFYYDMVKELKQRDIPFISLSPRDPIPPHVGVVITTSLETEAIHFDNVIAVSEDLRQGVRKALSAISKKASYQQMVVGVDPGYEPGVALIGDGVTLETAYAESPEAVRDMVERFMNGYDFQRMMVRIGHGDPTNRNRTINALRGLPVLMEIVNEENTTKTGVAPDLDAAVTIALSKGEVALGDFVVEATEGEKREMQRRSRIKSDGEITISKALAKKVVEGEVDLSEAISIQREKKKRFSRRS